MLFVSMVTAVASMGALCLMWHRNRFVIGSHPRYVLNNALIITEMTAVISLMISAALGMAHHDTVKVAICLTAAAAWCVNLYLALREDNWFNNQRTRLKRLARKLRARLHTIATPMPSPA